jgi:hypothetical protein
MDKWQAAGIQQSKYGYENSISIDWSTTGSVSDFNLPVYFFSCDNLIRGQALSNLYLSLSQVVFHVVVSAACPSNKGK